MDKTEKTEKTKLFSVPGLQFFSSGSTLLDLALGGGWPVGRIFNIVGDKSTYKTGLAIESFANFHLKFPKGRMRYAESEAAFDDAFAEKLGFPPGVERPEELLGTVEQFTDDLYKFSDEGGPSLYILDSLDALSDDAEVKRFSDRMEGKEVKGSMGAQKAKEMSEMFRLLVKDMGKKDCTLGIISQIRDNVGAMYGSPVSRSGGRSLDFYSTHCVWLYKVGTIDKTVKGEKRPIGVQVTSKVQKNKVGVPFREADFGILFGFGIDDTKSMLDWLLSLKEVDEKYAKEVKTQIDKARNEQNYEALQSIDEQLKADATRIWNDIEDKLTPKVQKYNQPKPQLAAKVGK